MKWCRHIGSLLLAGAIMITSCAPAFAVDETTAQPAASDNQTTQQQPASDTQTNTQSQAADAQNNTQTESQPDTTEQNTGGNKTENPADNQQQPEQPPEPDLDPQIQLSAAASICVNAQTGEIIHSKNSEQKQYPASTTKIMTALLVLENCKDLQDTVTMKPEDFSDVEGGASTAGFKEGENVTVESLLYGLLLPSGNEAANALARYVGGDVQGFVKMMNDKAKELGCKNTHFVNPNGLHDDNHYTCAYDLYLMAQEAMKYDTFQTIVNTALKKIPATNKNEERIIYTTNELIKSKYSPIYYDNCYGIKTGHTTPAGYCFVSYAKNSSGTISYYSVVMGCELDGASGYPASFTDTKQLFEWAFDKFSLKTATKGGTAVTESHVRLGKDKDNVTLVTAKDVNVLIPSDADISMLDVKIKAEQSYDAPIAKGQKLGTVTYSYNGNRLAKADLIALTDVERSQFLYFLDKAKNFMLSPIFMTIIVILVAILVILCLIRRHNKKRRRKKMLRQKRRQQRAGNPENRAVKTYTPQSQRTPRQPSQNQSSLEIKKRSLDKNGKNNKRK